MEIRGDSGNCSGDIARQMRLAAQILIQFGVAVNLFQHDVGGDGKGKFWLAEIKDFAVKRDFGRASFERQRGERHGIVFVAEFA